MSAALDVATLRPELTAVAVAADAAPMAAYMKGRFEFLGVKTPARRAASKQVFAAARRAPADEVLGFADRCWEQPEREFQYVGADVLSRNASRLSSGHLARLERLIVTKSWWDTVDTLASPTVGELVRTDPALVAVMDDWVGRENVWLVRTAILHQLRYGPDTDAARLFAYCARRSGDTEFFVRKAIGWALRQYARTDPGAVRRFVATNDRELSGLSKREALKHLSA